VNRRQIAIGGVAAAAGAAGVGTAWWKFRPHDAVRPLPADRSAAASTAEAGSPNEGAIDAFWKSSFDTPDGTPLAISSFKGKPLLVNFWATWCPPCIEELPLLDSFYQANKDKSWQLLGLAVDQPSAVRKWLQAKPLSFPVGMAGFGGTELSKSFGNLSGGLPFSVVFGASGQLLQRKTGKLSPEDLALWAQLK
jgi:thiol-disulfide isomerase/thioredoxin